MNCDVILEIGGKNSFKIDKESSKNELDSIQDIVEYLNTLPQHKVKLLLYDLLTSSTRLKNSLQYFLDKELIGNCSFEDLKLLFPTEMELLKDILKPYIITLIDEAYSNGSMIKGRVIVNGVVSYVFRNKFDVLNFAATEHKKHLVELTIDGNEILDSYLSEKYKSKLSIIRNNYKENLERISLEVDLNIPSELSIKHLIIDYLNNTSEYTKLIKNGEYIIDAGSVLNDFCRELNKQLVINEDSESDLARHLRRLNWKRESFGKSELYKSLIEYIPEFLLSISEQLFINLSIDNMEELLLNYFKDDIILKNYHVTSVETSYPQLIQLTKSLVDKLYKNTLDAKNIERKALGYLPLSAEYSDNITNLSEAQQFFSTGLYITIDNVTFPIAISENNGELSYTYMSKKLSNNSKIELKRIGKVLSLEFNFGYDTMNIFSPVNEDGVDNGYYQGNYIYRHTNEKGTDIFITSASVISPNLYDPPKFGSLKDAKLAIEGFNRSANLERATKVGIKLNINDTSGERHAIINFPTNTGLTINSIDYPINPRMKLLALENNMLTTKKMAEVLQYYKTLGIDISTLDLPEKVGTFLYAMTDAGYYINAILHKKLTEEDINAINLIISNISNANNKLYLVERSSRNKNGTYTVYLKSLTDSGIVINSTGVDIKGNSPTLSLTSTLYNLKETLENTLFKDTPISIVISDSDLLSQLTDPDGNRIFPNGTANVKAFIYNNNLYINLTNASINDLLHETFHIVLGALKAQDMKNGTKNYQNILNYYDKKVSSMTKDRVNDLYKNLANIDRIEEGVVRHLARQVLNGGMFYYEDKTNEALDLFRQLFLNILKSIRKDIKLDLDSDIGFLSSVNLLISEEIGQMLKNRIISNLIEQGIEKGLILENC